MQRIRNDRAERDAGGGEHERERHPRVSGSLEACTRPFSAPPQDDHTGDGKAIEDPRGKHDVGKQLLEAAHQRECRSPHSLGDDREDRHTEPLTHLAKFREKDSISGHREVDPRCRKNHAVCGAENGRKNHGGDQQHRALTPGRAYGCAGNTAARADLA